MMYRYDDHDRQIVRDRVAQFSEQVERRLSGELTEDEFRPLRLMNGLYLQLHAYMLRVAIPYGVLSSKQMRKLAHIARTYDKGYGHFTTRQNIQFNWPKLKDAQAILSELADVDMHAIQTSGNTIRNTTADQYAGLNPDEADDPRVWSEIIRQWSSFHPEFSFLPRKFKIAVTGCEHDRAAVRFHDIGVIAKRNEAGELGFQVLAGGGLGRTPMVAKVVDDFVPAAHLLSHLEAILRVYNQYGRRDNKFKARIKIMVHELGIEEVRKRVHDEWASIREGYVDLPAEEVERIRAFFGDPPFAGVGDEDIRKFEARHFEDKEFARWVRHNVAPHKQHGYGIANISLKPVGVPPGDATAEQMDVLADLADRFSFGEIRVTHEQNLLLPHVRKGELSALYYALREIGLADGNLNQMGDIICCPGLDYCGLANARSIPIAQRLSERFSDPELQAEIGEMRLKISGCINACGHHHVGHIGLLGVDRKGEEYYQVTLGGSPAEDASVGEIVGPAFSSDDVVDAVEAVIDEYRAVRRDGERFLDTYRRVGKAPFKDRLYQEKNNAAA